jgi:glycosyltransferase involved in cell wall biosynthesis
MSGEISQVGIGWSVGAPTGWGTYGTNLAVELTRMGISPVLFMLAQNLNLSPEQAMLLTPAISQSARWRALTKDGPQLDFPLLLSLNDGLEFFDPLSGSRGRPMVGIPFFESATMPPENVEGAKRFDLIIAGSTWNAEVMARHGVSHVRTCLQGVDLNLFKPIPKTGSFGERFVVFSGGKLEYRKGQDLVVAAFKRFHARHNDALLVAAWHNPWPKIAAGLALSTHVTCAPGVKADGTLDISGWLTANGLPEDSFRDVGALANTATPALLRDVDLAVFPNRCEGGTNLVAMECMAMGIPSVLACNTGHLDLIRPDNCYSLDFQLPIGEITKRPEMNGWGESLVDELVAKMEQAYIDRTEAHRRGAAAAVFMQNWGWPAQVARLVAALREFS